LLWTWPADRWRARWSHKAFRKKVLGVLLLMTVLGGLYRPQLGPQDFRPIDIIYNFLHGGKVPPN
jgi:hypothetical protein